MQLDKMDDKRLSMLLLKLRDQNKYNARELLFSKPGLTIDDYPKHKLFFLLGKSNRMRIFQAANQVGKSTAATFEVVCHLTGRYPSWWTGIRFNGPNDWWSVGVTLTEVQAILQTKYLGPVGDWGSGLIPRDCLDFDSLPDTNKADALVRTIRVKHVSGGWSILTLKASEQGRKSFQGAPVSVHLDEECPYDIFMELIARTTTSSEEKPLLFIGAFTPLSGVSQVIETIHGGRKLIFDEVTPGGFIVVNAGAKHAPHISAETIADLRKKYTPAQARARLEGLPVQNESAIYRPEFESIIVSPFAIPDHWPRAGGLDVGWNNTAATKTAYDRESGIYYTYWTYKRGGLTPSEHNEVLQENHGDWLTYNIDPAARGRSQRDGQTVLQNYLDVGLNVHVANNAVEAGIEQMNTLLVEGRLKVFDTCTDLEDEYKLYVRDAKGAVIKKNDHIMDAWRYNMCKSKGKRTGIDTFRTYSEYLALRADHSGQNDESSDSLGSWLNR